MSCGVHAALMRLLGPVAVASIVEPLKVVLPSGRRWG